MRLSTQTCDVMSSAGPCQSELTAQRSRRKVFAHGHHEEPAEAQGDQRAAAARRMGGRQQAQGRKPAAG